MARRVTRAVTIARAVARIVTVGMNARAVTRVVHARRMTSRMARTVTRGITDLGLIALGRRRTAGNLRGNLFHLPRGIVRHAFEHDRHLAGLSRERQHRFARRA